MDVLDVEAKALELLELEGLIEEWTDQPVGPYYYPNGKRLYQGGQAPLYHPRRCHAPSKHSGGHRCGRWACLGRDYCKFHGGKRTLRNPKLPPMPSAYAKHLMPTLAARLSEFLNSDERAEQILIFDEIALARVMLTQAIDTCTVLEMQPAGSVEIEHLLAARSQVRSGLELVADLCSKMARIDKERSDVVGVSSLGMFIEDVTRMIFRRLGDNNDVALALADDLKQVRLPGSDAIDPGVRIIEVGAL